MGRLVNASLHRFGDKVAISLPGNGETLYLSPKEARQLAFALYKGARSIDSCKFANSEFGTVEVALENEGKR